jgi:hypothetical protein
MALSDRLKNLSNPTGINTDTLFDNMGLIGKVGNKLGEAGVETTGGRRFNPITGDMNKLLPVPDSTANGVPLKKVYGRRMGYSNIENGGSVGVRNVGYVPLSSLPDY